MGAVNASAVIGRFLQRARGKEKEGKRAPEKGGMQADANPYPISFTVLPKRSPVSVLSAPAPSPYPTPFGPYLRPWHCLQYSSAPCSATDVESSSLLHIAEAEGERVDKVHHRQRHDECRELLHRERETERDR